MNLDFSSEFETNSSNILEISIETFVEIEKRNGMEMKKYVDTKIFHVRKIAAISRGVGGCARETR